MTLEGPSNSFSSLPSARSKFSNSNSRNPLQKSQGSRGSQSATSQKAEPLFNQFAEDGMLPVDSVPMFLEEMGLGNVEHADLLQSLTGPGASELSFEQW